MNNNHTCNCQHNSNSRDNEPCCRCDSKQTNADRIRNMSDEELAEFIEQISTDSMETISFGTKEYKVIWEHKETALEWLQSEVEKDYQLDGLKEETEEDREL